PDTTPSAERPRLWPYAIIPPLAFVTLAFFLPLVWLHPLAGPRHALSTFSNFTELHTVYFGGQILRSSEIPWTYIPTWLAMELPEALLLGLLLAAVLCIILLLRGRRPLLPALDHAHL